MAVPREIRVASLIQEKIGALIIERKIKDSRVDSFLSITRIVVSRDLAFADVFVSSYKTESGLEKGVAGLQSAAGFIQAKLAESMRIRKTPKLRFHIDKGLREGFVLNQKIDELCSPSGE
ncbi:MAG: 30S ribosome-binding factor RbfA [Spirochaetaceae bacterium]|jgi:ribosome-binding factor A|nr:30S ribosome-binding factor RbfA [Spirochaetaceae bacterium]